MERRSVLQAVGAGGAMALAGCLDGVLESGAEGAVLGPPETDLSQSSHPTYGDEIPSFSVPDAFTGEVVTDEQFHGERAMLMTFFFTSCPDGLCPVLLQMLNMASEDATREGYDDDVAFVGITFDPEYDTTERLQEEVDSIGIDPSAENWHILRPEDNDEAYDVVAGDFGTPVHLEHDDHEEHDDGHGDGAESHDDHDGHDDNDHGEHETDRDDHENHDDAQVETAEPTDGTHVYIILLVNENGIVERSYPGATNYSAEEIIDDLRTVVEG
ncbi:SCO family protein [Natrarchaeobaculum aegyptiacum]|uniref:Thioredoxin domain-containing protein n=1 Tax=Natrarchaeobaculum aegyptiacum TaxID=745377 RepID=A0A2Z2HW75_9EURY|nr:SCO family protein [Natrarchaeobaculum aegyptiacum]ARS91063.1 hypothetical protein B1756_15870 [Natrarchaeobaculum aegyptiacum]